MKKAILFAGIFIFLYSCEKEKETTSNDKEVTENKKSSYLPMAVGNYWIYQEIYIDSNESKNSDYCDSVVITKDTTIRSRTFYLFDTYRVSSSTYLIKRIFYADSSMNLITPGGSIHFSENNFTDILFSRPEIYYTEIDTLAWTTFKMGKIVQPITVPTGTFTNVLDMKGTITYNNKLFPEKPQRYLNNYYAKGVGKILYTTLFLLDPDNTSIEYRLVRSNIIY